jgi:hypothetical protein
MEGSTGCGNAAILLQVAEIGRQNYLLSLACGTSRSSMMSAALDSQVSFPLSFIQIRMSIPRRSQMPAAAGDQLFGLAGTGTNEA